jgi:hypothetical protein
MRDSAEIAKMAQVQPVHPSILSNDKIDTMYFIYPKWQPMGRVPSSGRKETHAWL